MMLTVGPFVQEYDCFFHRTPQVGTGVQGLCLSAHEREKEPLALANTPSKQQGYWLSPMLTFRTFCIWRLLVGHLGRSGFPFLLYCTVPCLCCLGRCSVSGGQSDITHSFLALSIVLAVELL